MAKVDLRTPVWDDDKRLYLPGKDVELPDALAAKLKGGTSSTDDNGSLDGVDFASEAAREAAMEAGLTAADFEGSSPSSANGYTKPDVQALVDKA